ncbi:hypothetical protein LOK49_LG08G02746 [Camellia lanceoleosa]|uniref:Uncharacterized protein n=1 Tax=Camellia lanceoleosa TaxID=1840588 RepID=A0ACC0GUI2_9ERIC|nr:hypothetical protein LOK49_LG08G02746 [Camellia lanceoleosa]
MDSFELLEGTDECEDVSHRCLVAKVLAPKLLNKPAVSNILLGAWKTRAGVSITPWNDNMYFFQFEDVEDRQRVLDESPWSVVGNLLVLQILQLGRATTELEFQGSPFWVQVHGLLIDKMTRVHGEVIGNRIGRLVEVKAPTTGLFLHHNFLRLRVEVDVLKPLLQGFILYRRNNTKLVGDGIKVFYKYEKLTEFFYDCGHIGHDNASCKFVSKDEGLNSGYGLELRTGPARSLVYLLGQQRRSPTTSQPVGDQSVERPSGGTAGVERGLEPPAPRKVAENVTVLPDPRQKVDKDATETVPSKNRLPRTPVVSLDSSSSLSLSTYVDGVVTRPKISPSRLQSDASVLGLGHDSNEPFLKKATSGPKSSYFVTEPVEESNSVLYLAVDRPHLEIRMEELSPSPERHKPTNSLMDISISQVFKSLSLKRPLLEENCYEQHSQKRVKTNLPGQGAASDLNPTVAVKDLSLVCSKPKTKTTGRKARNEHLFNHCPVDPIEVIAKAKREEAVFLAACEVDSAFVETTTGAQCSGPQWVLPPIGIWKINCDTATDLSREREAVAVLLRDEKGNLLDGIAAKIRLTTVVQEKAIAVRLACAMARALQCTVVEIESDSKTVIQLCIQRRSLCGKFVL